jgi:hypothetical protein
LSSGDEVARAHGGLEEKDCIRNRQMQLAFLRLEDEEFIFF